MSTNSQILTTKSLIVNLRISNWAARKYDRKVSKEIEEQKDAHEAGRYNKILVTPGRMKKITQAISKARTMHDRNTLPWDDNGGRLLPAENYFPYVSELSDIKNEFDSAVQEFIQNYDEAMIDAKVRLKDMFDPRDYPVKGDLYHRFDMKMIPMPVPETDFRVNLGEVEVEKLKDAVEKEFANRLNGAVTSIWERVKEQLDRMKDRLSDKDAIFHNTMFENLKTLVDILPRLNVTGDINVIKVCEDMKKLIVEPDEVRKDVRLRAQKAQEVDAIMNKFGSFFQ